LLEHAACNDIERGGRYDVGAISGFDDIEDAERLAIIVWSHPWDNPATKEESTPICQFALDRTKTMLVGVNPMPGFDRPTALIELGILEHDALGRSIHGRVRG